MSPIPDLTTGQLVNRLSGTRLREDPTAVVLPPGSERWPAEMRESLTASLKPAGVLIPIIDCSDAGLSVLLTKRSSALKHHAGQIAFPGGRMEDHDADITATALRETHEEVGIPPENVSIAGFLPPMPTVTGYAVTPVVGLIEEGVQLTLDPSEVDAAFEVPLAFLLDERNERTAERDFNGQKIPIVEFRYEGYRIWGATAHMLLVLRQKLY